jgi:exodeoxyribonuclease VII large subunit
MGRSFVLPTIFRYIFTVMKSTGIIFSVSDLTKKIKGILEMNFKNIALQGEISNCKLHSSGHIYFTLKDEHAQIQGVMWRSRAANLFFTPQDGMKVIARGNITLYEVRGVYQIDVVQLQPLGVGELQMAFERLKQSLAAEGLFDAQRKKPLPLYPASIGLVTSSTGAALRDILNILQRRFPSVEVILNPVKVQGAGAAEEIAMAIRDFNTFGKIDVMIIGRGGGSLEDLWAFNEEIVARAIFDSRIPIVSAVGHEIDFTIADFVADLRAPTPSAAAELVVPNRTDLVEIVRNFHYNCRQLIAEEITSQRENIISLLQSYSFNTPFDRLRQHSQRVDELQRTLRQNLKSKVELTQQHLGSLSKRIASLNPETVLARGYAMVYRDDVIISDAHVLRRDEKIELKFRDGRKSTTVD